MDDKIIKEALSYSLGADLHEEWRLTRKRKDGTFEPRMKKSKDEAWTTAHGTDDVDIANTSFADLPSNWQEENLLAAKVVIELVYDKVIAEEEITVKEREKMAAKVHEEWLKRNGSWAEEKLKVPYEQLPEVEKEKDRVQLVPAIAKVKAYKNGEIDIDSLCEQYGIEKGRAI